MSTQDLEASMRKSVEATQRNFNTIRTGRANSSLLDRISVEYYGADTPLKSLAALSTPDSQTIQIQPFDISALASIEKAIAMSELGFTPNNDGKIIRINVPPLTEERRKEIRLEYDATIGPLRRDFGARFGFRFGCVLERVPPPPQRPGAVAVGGVAEERRRQPQLHRTQPRCQRQRHLQRQLVQHRSQ